MIARNLILIVGHTEMETSNYPLSIMFGASLQLIMAIAYSTGVSESPHPVFPGVSVTRWSVAVSADTETTAERCDGDDSDAMTAVRS